MEGAAFMGLFQLRTVGLEQNLCINFKFLKLDLDRFPIIISSSCGANKEDVACERIRSIFDESHCHMQDVTVINGRNHSFSDQFNEQMDSIIFHGNKNIQFLPISVHQKFPNLVAILAENCSILEIYRENFEKLTKLELLFLSGNKIYTIWSDTFSDLTAVRKIYLGSVEFVRNGPGFNYFSI